MRRPDNPVKMLAGNIRAVLKRSPKKFRVSCRRDVSVHVVAGVAPYRERGPTSDVEVDAVGGDVVAQVGGRTLVPAGVLHRDRVEQNRAVSDRHTRGTVVCGHNAGKY